MLGILALLGALTTAAYAENGNIYPNAIEVDGDLYPAGATGDCVNGALEGNVTGFDWVADCASNTDLTVGTDAAVQAGHWNGYRIVDGIAGADQDIFLAGGKENDLSTWSPGPGTVGSAKYDITQAYIANNTTDAFFGMERRGNNGTTAFDWEFNKLAPSAANPDYVPTRSECDVLVTFEMQGSGKTGSAVPHIFRYDDPDVDGTAASPAALTTQCQSGDTYAGDANLNGFYVEVSSSSVDTQINEVSIPAAPWGFVDSKGNWTTGSLDRYEFAEAKVPLTLLGIDGQSVCSDISRYLQVRTRSSATDNSDLKDLTKIRSFSFFQPTNPNTSLQELCKAQFHFGTSDLNGAEWKFSYDYDSSNPITLTGLDNLQLTGPTDNGTTRSYTTTSSTVVSGNVQVNFPDPGPGVPDNVTINVKQTGTGGNGCSTNSTGSIVVDRALGVTASLTPHCGNTFDYSASSTGGTGTKTYSWVFQQKNLGDGTWSDVPGAVGTSSQKSGTVTMPSTGTYRGVVTVTDSAVEATGKPACSVTIKTDGISVYGDVTAKATAASDCTSTFGWTATAGGGKAPYDITVTVQKQNSSGDWVDQSSGGSPFTFTGVTQSGDGTCGDFCVSGTYDASGSPGIYRVHVVVSDSQQLGAEQVPCTAKTNSAPIDVRDPLSASAAKDANTTDGTTLTVGLDGGHQNALAADTVTYQWQYSTDGTTWTDLSSKGTSEDTTYSTFKQDSTPSATSFTAGGYSYVGQVWSLELRLVVKRVSPLGLTCKAQSDPLTVRMIQGVDP